MKRIICITAAIVLLLVPAFVFAGGKQEAPKAAGEKGPQTAEELTIGIYNDAGNVTIWGGGAYSPWVLDSVCERLTGPSPSGEELEMVLAEYVKPVTDDNTVWEIKLKAGVKWHDGTPLTSEDVKFTINYNREGPSNNRYSHHTSAVPRLPGEGITIIDELTLRVTGAFPMPYFDREPCAELPIVQKAQWENIEDPRQFVGKSIGTGPYMLIDYKVGEYYKLEANPDYHMGKPLVGRLTLVVIKDLSTMFTALRSGEIDGAARTMPVELVADWKGDPNLNIVQVPYMWGACVTLDNKNLPFGDLKTRKALSLCIDRDELLEIVALGQGLSGTLGYPHPEAFHASPDSFQAYDPAAGKKMFDELGYIDVDGDGFRENPDGTKLDWRIIAETSQPLYVRAGEILVDQLENVNIRAHVEAMEKASFSETLYKKGNYNMSVGEFVPHGLCDDDMMMVLQYGEKKTDLMPYAERDQALLDWKAAGDKEGRLEASYKLQALINKYPKRVMLWYPHGFFAYNKNAYDNYSIVRGYNIFNKYSFIPNDARDGFVLEDYPQTGFDNM
ncbi:MAG: ABC transporter substrate-binding protein [Spirochaetales bacterium]|nr:ABC transporter substrate-binding protein [Spirochaetales bacterium]